MAAGDKCVIALLGFVLLFYAGLELCRMPLACMHSYVACLLLIWNMESVMLF